MYSVSQIGYKSVSLLMENCCVVKKLANMSYIFVTSIANMIYHWGASLSEQCIADLMFCHGTQTMDNSRICHCLLFDEHAW